MIDKMKKRKEIHTARFPYKKYELERAVRDAPEICRACLIRMSHMHIGGIAQVRLANNQVDKAVSTARAMRVLIDLLVTKRGGYSTRWQAHLAGTALSEHCQARNHP